MQAALPALRVPPRQDSLPQPSMAAESPAAFLLGSRGVEAAALPSRRPAGTGRAPSRFRGCTYHSRTNRYESHIWQDSKQCYLGGYYVEEQAAMAYDLAAVRFRGCEATTNFPLGLFERELAEAEALPKQAVVEALRSQSKAMSRLDTAGSGGGAAPGMEGWELAVSEAIQQGSWASLGVFGSEVEAARAVDRALLGRRGVEAATNFPLVDYVGLLTVAQVEEAVARGLLPPTLPANYAPAPAPTPLLTVDSCLEALAQQQLGDPCPNSELQALLVPAPPLASILTAAVATAPSLAAAATTPAAAVAPGTSSTSTSGSGGASLSCGASPAAHAGTSEGAAAGGRLVTPRSVLDLHVLEQTWVAGKRPVEDDVSAPLKRARLEPPSPAAGSAAADTAATAEMVAGTALGLTAAEAVDVVLDAWICSVVG